MIDVCIAFDDRYIMPAQVLLTSILMNSTKNDQLRINILDNGINEKTKIQIEKLKQLKYFDINYVNIDKNKFEHFPLPKNGHFSQANYYRISIPTLMPIINKILYLDCDMIVKRSLNELFNIDLLDNVIGAVKSVTSYMNNRRLGLAKFSPYINSGVMLINASKWRHEKVESKIIDYIKSAPEEKLKNIEQDAINFLLSKSIYYLKRNWNVELRNDIIYPNYYRKYLDNPYITHYNSTDKPWLSNTQHETSLFNVYKCIRDRTIAT